MGKVSVSLAPWVDLFCLDPTAEILNFIFYFTFCYKILNFYSLLIWFLFFKKHSFVLTFFFFNKEEKKLRSKNLEPSSSLRGNISNFNKK